MLLKLNIVFFKLFQFVNHELRLNINTIHGQHYSLKTFILPTLIYLLVRTNLKEVTLHAEKQAISEDDDPSNHQRL